MKKNFLIVFCIDTLCILLVCYVYFYTSFFDAKLSEHFFISGIILIFIALTGLIGGAKSTVHTDPNIQRREIAQMERDFKNNEPLIDWKFAILMLSSSLPLFILHLAFKGY